MSNCSLIARMGATFCLAASTAAAQQGGVPDYGRGHWDGPWHGWFMGPVMMIIFLAILVIVVVLLVRWLGGSGGNRLVGGHASSATAPLDILKERFARGEIDKAEYEERRKTLRD